MSTEVILLLVGMKTQVIPNPFEQINKRLDALEGLLLSMKNPNAPVYQQDETLNADQLSKRYNLPLSTIYKKTSLNEIPHFKKGKKLYFSKLAIERWLRENPVRTLSEIESEAATHIATK